MSARIQVAILGSLLIGFAGCAKQGSILSQVAGNAASTASGGGVSAASACSSASNSLITYYPSLSNCTSVWGSGNCSLVIVAYNGANYSCYMKTVASGSSSGSGSSAGSTTLLVSPSTGLNLGSVTVSSLSSSTATYTVTNSSATVAATGCSVSLSNPSVFAISSNNCGSSIAAGGSCSVGVVGTPLSENSFTTNLTIGCANAGTGTVRQVSVTGVASGGTSSGTTSGTTSGSGSSSSGTTSGSGSGGGSVSLSVSPATGTSLGSVIVGLESSAANYTFTNSGTVTATGCSVVASNPSIFTLDHLCGSSLAAGASCAVWLTGIPVSATSYSSSITFSCTNGGSSIGRTVTMLGISGGGSGGGTTTSGGGTGSCFIAGVRIEMADGSFKPIEKVKVGDRVRGAGGGVNRVTKIFVIPHQGAKYAFNGGKAFFTDSHPFLSEQGWRSLNPIVSSNENPGLAVLSMKTGDVILTRDGSVRIHSIESGKSAETVYNFRTDGDHSYLADGYKVHNAEIKTTTSGGGGTGSMY